MHIRAATIADRDDILRIHLRAFDEGEREIVAKLATDLLSEDTTPRTISLVAETDGATVGHIAFSPAAINGNKEFHGSILAPLGVLPDHQKRRTGSRLVERGLRLLSAQGVHVVFVYGDPAYYARFGFSAGAALPYAAPYKLEHPFGWQAIALNKYALKKTPAAITCVTSLRNPNLW